MKTPNPLRKLTKEELQILFDTSSFIKEILIKVGVNPRPKNYKLLKERAEILGISRQIFEANNKEALKLFVKHIH